MYSLTKTSKKFIVEKYLLYAKKKGFTDMWKLIDVIVLTVKADGIIGKSGILSKKKERNKDATKSDAYPLSIG